MLEFAEKYPESARGQYVAAGMQKETWMQSADQYQTPYAHYLMAKPFYNADDLATVNETATLIDDYVAGAEAKFINGDMEIGTEYDVFIKTIEAYGVSENMEIVTAYTAK